MARSRDSEHVYYDNDEHDLAREDERPPPSNTETGGDEDDIVVLSESNENRSYSRRNSNNRRIQKYQNRGSGHHDGRSRSPAIMKRKSHEKADEIMNGNHKDEETTTRNSDCLQPEELPLGCTLYVRNLPTHFHSEQVRSYFSRHGDVVDCRIVINPVTKESRGFGFVTYRTVEISERAMAQMDQSEVDGRILRVEKARRNKPHDPTPGEYKGPTDFKKKGASIKYDNRGRLKPGYVPYWDLPPPRSSDRGRSAGHHHRDHYYYHYHRSRSRSHPRYQRRSYNKSVLPRGRSPSSNGHYYDAGGHNGGYYYSPSPRHYPSTSVKDSRYYDYTKQRHGDDNHSSSYRTYSGAHSGANRDSRSPPRRLPVSSWNESRHYCSPPSHRYSSIDRHGHNTHATDNSTNHHHRSRNTTTSPGHYGDSRRGYYNNGGGDCSMHSNRPRRSSSRTRVATGGRGSGTEY